MIKAHIPTGEQYAFVEIDYQNIDELEKNYADDYVSIRLAQRKAHEMITNKELLKTVTIPEKPSPKV